MTDRLCPRCRLWLHDGPCHEPEDRCPDCGCVVVEGAIHNPRWGLETGMPCRISWEEDPGAIPDAEIADATTPKLNCLYTPNEED